MILVDTHVLVWARAARDRLSTPARLAIESAGSVVISDITLWELAMLLDKGRLSIDRPVSTYLAEVSASVTVLPITAAVASKVTDLPDGFPADPADRIIYATAQVHDLELVSADRSIRGADPGVIW